MAGKAPSPKRNTAKSAAVKPAPAKQASAKSAPAKTATAKSGASKAPAVNDKAKSAPAKKEARSAKPTAPAKLATKKGPIALRTPAARKSTPDDSGTYYIVVEHDDLRISTERPKTNGRLETAESFIEAKEKAVDRLIDLIDSFERRLWQVKQSNDHQSLVGGE
jgi:hypothetical protein